MCIVNAYEITEIPAIIVSYGHMYMNLFKDVCDWISEYLRFEIISFFTEFVILEKQIC